MSVPALNYASKNYTINLSDKKKMESAEMWFLCSVAGYAFLDIQSELNLLNLTKGI
jgi:hypothetical protein